MLKQMPVLALVLVALLASTSFAGEYTILPTNNISTGTPNSIASPYSSPYATAAGEWNSGLAVVGNIWDMEYRNYEQYNIPTYPGEVITSVVANVNVADNLSNPPWTPSIYLDLTDSTWSNSGNVEPYVSGTKPPYVYPVIGGTQLTNRVKNLVAYETVMGLVTTDITSYLSPSYGTGQGLPLSIRFSRDDPFGSTPIRNATLSYDGVANHYLGVSLTITTAPVAVSGDVNFDGVVNIFDINLVSAHWDESGPAGDANGDMAVNIFDINLISSNWTTGGGASAAAVPEPGTLGLLAMGLAIGGYHMRHRQRRTS